jgi:Tol biopolymer transport system component
VLTTAFSQARGVDGTPVELARSDAIHQPAHVRWPISRALTIAVIVLSVGGLIAVTVNHRIRSTAGSASSITRLTNIGTVRLASLSSDGEQIAYVRSDGVRESLWIRRVTDPNPVELVSPVAGTFGSLTAGADGFVYYNLFRPTLTAAPLHRVSLADRKVETISATASGIGFSRDGSRGAYVTTTSMAFQESQLIVSDIGWTNPRPLAVRRAPESFVKAVKPAWSPDGAQLAVFATSMGASPDPRLLLIDTQDGRVRGTRTPGLVEVNGMVWLTGDRLVVSGRERRVSPQRLWEVTIASGAKRPLTHDLSDYALAGVTPDGDRVVAVQGDVARTFWTASLSDPAAARQVAADSGSLGGLEGIAWGSNHLLFYATAQSENVDIWSVDVLSGARRRLTFDTAEDYQPSVSADGTTIAFVSTRSGVPAVWAMSSDGTAARQLTTGNDSRPSISPDGQWVAFQRQPVDTLPFSVWRVPVGHGDPSPLATHHTMRPSFSPDGKTIAHYWMTSAQWSLALTAMSGGLPLKTFPLSPTHLERVVRWFPNGRGLTFIDGVGGVSNIWLQPLDGGPPRSLTSFSEGTISTFDWSSDGSTLAWVRTTEMHDIVRLDLSSREQTRR